MLGCHECGGCVLLRVRSGTEDVAQQFSIFNNSKVSPSVISAQQQIALTYISRMQGHYKLPSRMSAVQ